MLRHARCDGPGRGRAGSPAEILRLPLSPGSLETDLLFWLTDLWVVPARAELAERARDVILARTAAAVAGVAAETSIAFDEVLFRTADRDLAAENLQVLSAAADRIRVRHQSGQADDFDVHQADARAAGQRIELAAAERELTLARARLDRLMGPAPEQTGYAVAGDLEDPPASRWTAETALAFALEHRLDLAAARHAVETAARNVEFQERLIVRRLQVGGGFEGNFRASNPGGPAVAMEIPLFDRNQAQIARAGFRLRQAQKTLAAMEQEARQEIVLLLADRDLHRTHVEVCRGRPAETRRKAVEFAERFAALMQLNWTFFFEARAAEVHARRGYLRALWGLRAAEADLHRALWGGVGRPHIGDLMPINPELTFRPPVTGGRQRGLQ